ncbi:MAG: hypothetical protein ACPGVD_03455, partial [Flavobacteriales bacterium]
MKNLISLFIIPVILLSCESDNHSEKTEDSISDKRKVIRGDWSKDKIDTTNYTGFKEVKEYLGRGDDSLKITKKQEVKEKFEELENTPPPPPKPIIEKKVEKVIEDTVEIIT